MLFFDMSKFSKNTFLKEKQFVKENKAVFEIFGNTLCVQMKI
jgi:hypothetical protein